MDRWFRGLAFSAAMLSSVEAFAQQHTTLQRAAYCIGASYTEIEMLRSERSRPCTGNAKFCADIADLNARQIQTYTDNLRVLEGYVAAQNAGPNVINATQMISKGSADVIRRQMRNREEIVACGANDACQRRRMAKPPSPGDLYLMQCYAMLDWMPQ